MQAPAPPGTFVFAPVPALARAPGALQPQVEPSPRTIQSTPSVLEVFSCLLPQSSLGTCRCSISACRGSPRGRAYLGAVYVLSQCYGILPIYKPPAHSVKESRFSANPRWPPLLRVIPCSSPSKSITQPAQPGQRLRLPWASANSGDAPWPCAGWLVSMIRPLMRKVPFILACSLVAAAFPHALRAQLVRENTAPPQPQVPAKQESQNSASVQTPPGKKRLSQEVQLTGEDSWIDTTIDIQAGEHVLITATGKLRYADAKDDNGPDGIPRGFKDLLRVLPFNEAGRGALIGRIGDKDTAQPFVIGARRDVLAPVSGRLSVGINQITNDTGDGNY